MDLPWRITRAGRGFAQVPLRVSVSGWTVREQHTQPSQNSVFMLPKACPCRMQLAKYTVSVFSEN